MATIAEPAHAPRYWWVNHKQTFAQEVEGGYIWAPTRRQDGHSSVFYDNLTRVQVGDVVFSFAYARVQAIGVCVAPAALAPKPAEFGASGDAWEEEGWRVDVAFERLSHPMRPKDHADILAPTLPKKYSPIRATGDGNQAAYLAEVPAPMAHILKELLSEQWAANVTRIERAAAMAVEHMAEQEDDVAQRIHNRTDIGPTERASLVRARRGQGLYRKNLEALENGCRVTGVVDRVHLRASHIKPWRLSTDHEKLDGNNGLLLSPHVDHLFDGGYISFTDQGKLLKSAVLDPEVLMKWHIIAASATSAPLRTAQAKYMHFHRAHVFKRE